MFWEDPRNKFVRNFPSFGRLGKKTFWVDPGIEIFFNTFCELKNQETKLFWVDPENYFF